MIYYRDRMCYIVLREGDRTVQISHTVPTNPQIAEELLHMHLAKAYEQMVGITDNKEIKEAVLAGLQRNKEKYGKRYCPCSLVRDDDTVCMCKEFREMEEGMCHCQLYIKTKDESIQG